MITILRCEDCHRQILQVLAMCPVCRGAVIVEKRTRLNRIEFAKRRLQCSRCQYYGTFRGRTGCGMLKKACDVEQLWLKQTPDWCPMGLADDETLPGVIAAVRRK